MMPKEEADLARWTEEVLMTLRGATDASGLKVYLGYDLEIKILAHAMTALTNMRADALPGSAFATRILGFGPGL